MVWRKLSKTKQAFVGLNLLSKLGAYSVNSKLNWHLEPCYSFTY